MKHNSPNDNPHNPHNPHNSPVIYIYDGSLDGFLTCVFQAFSLKERPELISKKTDVQLSFGTEIREIETKKEAADRVHTGIIKKLGDDTLTTVYHAVLSAEEDAETTALTYLRLGFKYGTGIYNNLADGRIMRMSKISRNVSWEGVRFMELLRFSELEGNILIAEFEPFSHVLPIIMPHFADRLSTQPFIINDKKRKLAAVYDTKQWYLLSSEDMVLPDYSSSETQYRDMWKLFFNSIAIKERTNLKLQMQHMPKKYWKHITEMK